MLHIYFSCHWKLITFRLSSKSCPMQMQIYTRFCTLLIYGIYVHCVDSYMESVTFCPVWVSDITFCLHQHYNFSTLRSLLNMRCLLNLIFRICLVCQCNEEVIEGLQTWHHLFLFPRPCVDPKISVGNGVGTDLDICLAKLYGMQRWKKREI